MVKVLDHGFVRLTDRMGSDLSIVRNARNSHDASWRSGSDTGSDRRLIRYLWQQQHTTPFEAVTLTFQIKCPLFVARQWHRHRTWSYNEMSARYTELPEEFYIPDAATIGIQDTKNRQGRVLETANSEVSTMTRLHQLVWYERQCRDAFTMYRKALAPVENGGWGWPRELARGMLPAATYTQFFGTVNLLNLFRFIKLRSDLHAQHEIRVYSDAMLALIQPIVPVAVEAFMSDPTSPVQQPVWISYGEAITHIGEETLNQLTKATQHPFLLDPPCAGVHHLRGPGACERCGATWDQSCLDYAAYEAQLAAKSASPT
jgi:thymidylate synthase (FAD)